MMSGTGQVHVVVKNSDRSAGAVRQHGRPDEIQAGAVVVTRFDNQRYHGYQDLPVLDGTVRARIKDGRVTTYDAKFSDALEHINWSAETLTFYATDELLARFPGLADPSAFPNRKDVSLHTFVGLLLARQPRPDGEGPIVGVPLNQHLHDVRAANIAIMPGSRKNYKTCDNAVPDDVGDIGVPFLPPGVTICKGEYLVRPWVAKAFIARTAIEKGAVKKVSFAKRTSAKDAFADAVMPWMRKAMPPGVDLDAFIERYMALTTSHRDAVRAARAAMGSA